MTLTTVTTDVAMLKQTVAFFKELGFCDQYIKEVENDLLQREQKVAQWLSEHS
jgi:hypothetical protein